MSKIVKSKILIATPPTLDSLGGAPLASPTFTGTATTPILNISSVPSNDDALTSVLVRAADGTIKYRASTSISSPVLTANKIYIDSINGVNATGVVGDVTKPYLTREYVNAILQILEH